MRSIQDNVFKGTGITDTQNSERIDIRQVYGLAVQAVITKNSGTVEGSFKIQASCKADPNASVDADWVDTDQTDNLIDGDNTFLQEVDGAHYGFIRLVLTLTSGNIDFNCFLSTKG